MTPKKKVEPAPLVPPFVRYVASAIPMVFDDSLSYYECLAALTKYLQDLADVVNNNGTVTEEYIQLTKDMKTYMDTYFDNLDVQEEINNKLDEMTTDGTLTYLIKSYVDPIYQEYENAINAEIAELSDDISDINTKVNRVASGSPLAASSVEDMTDTEKIYVNTSDGYWYYYDGTDWQQGGIYLSSDNTDKIDNLVGLTLSWTEGYYINSDGNLASNAYYKYCDYIPVLHDGISIPLRIFTKGFKNTYAVGYDSAYNIIETIKLSNSDSLEIIEKVIKNNKYHYVRFCSEKDYAATAYYTNLGNISVSEISGIELADDSISASKVTFIKGSQYRNLIDKSSLTAGAYINSAGNISYTEKLNASDFIPVNHETTYLYSSIRAEYYAYYDENHVFLSGYSTLGNLSDGTFTPPENAKYMRCTIHDNDLKTSYIALVANPLAYRNTLDSVIPSKFCDYNGKEISVFNKILCIGDSLTQGIFNKTGSHAYVSIPKYSYPTILHKITGVDVTNAGDSGKTFESWYANHSSDDLSGHDLCIIALGANNNSWGDSQITALTNIINKVKTENNKIHIFVSSIIPAYSYKQSYYNTINAGIKALVDSLNDTNVKYVDLTTYGHTNDSMCFNTGHLSAYGYNRLAQDYANYICFDMMRNPNDYRFVQFSNTDYEY